jgi:hypothetical protein
LIPSLETAKKKLGTFEKDYVPFSSSKKKNSIASNTEAHDADEESVDEEDVTDDAAHSAAMQELAELTLPVFERMPSESELEAARLQAPVECDDADGLVEHEARQGSSYLSEDRSDGVTVAHSKPFKSSRQTLLFSATAIHNQVLKGKVQGETSKKKKHLKAQYSQLPQHLQQ